MTIRGAAYIAGAYEHPQRRITGRSLLEVHADVAAGALTDAGLGFDDVDAYFCDTEAPGLGPLSMADYLGLRLRHVDSTDIGGSAYLSHVGHAAAAIALGRCDVALITMAGLPRSAEWGPVHRTHTPEYAFEALFGSTTPAAYALAARRHMYEFGTTSEQLAAVKVTASEHAQHNPHALLRDVVTVEQVLASPFVADPLHRLDCCVITDGGGALVVVSPAVARRLDRHCVAVLGQAEAVKHAAGGAVDLTYTGAVWSGPRAFAEAGIGPGDVDYASIYDSFTITVVETVEDLGFCVKGDGGPFVASGALRSPGGALPCNTDGGGLCNNHPGNRGGMPKVIEAVRQLRGEAHPALQVPGCEIAIAHGTGGSLATRMASSTLVLGRDPVPAGWPA